MGGNGGLLDPEDEALEVLTLGMVDVDGMVGRLCELMQDAHLAAALCCCAEHSESELLLAHGLRAGEGEEHSPTLNLAESLGVETPIAHECVLEGALVLGKCWRVEDDEVVGVGLDMVEEIEGILSKGLVPAVARVIKLHVAASEAHSLAGAVDAVDELCPATHGIEGESTSVAEHVEHTSVVAVALEQGAVLALIDEEASLLASEPVDMELESVLDCDIGVELTNEILILGVEMSFIGQCGLALVVNIADNPRRQIDQSLSDALAREVHAWGEGLDDGDMAAWEETSIDHKNFEQIHDELSVMGADLMCRVIPDIVSGKAVYLPQKDEEATYARRLVKQDGKIDFSRSPEAIERQIRAFDPWPGAFCTNEQDGRMWKIWKAECPDTDCSEAPGTVVASSPKGIDISCGGQILRVTELQIQGKKRMAADAFLRGRTIEKGTRFV